MNLRSRIGTITLSLFSLSLLLAPVAVASSSDFSAHAPSGGIFSFEFELPPTLRDLFRSAVEQEIANDTGPQAEMARLYLDGARLGVNAGLNPETDEIETGYVLANLPMPKAVWDFLIKENPLAVELTHNGVDVHSDPGISFVPFSLAYAGDLVLAVVGKASTDNMKTILDLLDGTRTDSLNTDSSYKEIANTFLESNFMELYLDLGTLIAKIEEAGEIPEEELVGANLLKAVYDRMGFSAAEENGSFSFSVVLKGNPTALAEQDLSLNPGGSFVPYLYKEFPDAPVLLYSESFNPKANWNMATKINEQLASIDPSFGDVNDVFVQIKSETGIDIESVYATFDKGFAWSVQYEPGQAWPYVTIMGDISSNPSAGVELRSQVIRLFTTQFLPEVPDGIFNIILDSDQTLIEFDPTAIEGYDGPTGLKKTTFTVGVTDDDRFIISNYPGIARESVREGINQAHFNSAYEDKDAEVMNISYISNRQLWNFADNFLSWLESSDNGQFTPTLDEYRQYYQLLETLYPWRDLFVVSTGTTSSMKSDGRLLKDDEKHETFREFLGSLEGKDTDGDGVNDYKERFVYRTSVDVSDSDKDGINDVEELKMGLNPHGEGRIFSDIGEDEWFTDAVGRSWNYGVIKGFDDKTYRPAELVTRAEFIAMVVRAFEETKSEFLGFQVQLSRGFHPFDDVNSDMWFNNDVAKAYKAGLVKGNETEDEFGFFRTKLRPLDPITRAEAIAILNRATDKLRFAQERTDPTLPFSDVSTDDWFYQDVSRAYRYNMTDGRSPKEFAPAGELSRAEAAAFILRALDLKLNVPADKQLENFQELPSGLVKGLL